MLEEDDYTEIEERVKNQAKMLKDYWSGKIKGKHREHLTGPLAQPICLYGTKNGDIEDEDCEEIKEIFYEAIEETGLQEEIDEEIIDTAWQRGRENL